MKVAVKIAAAAYVLVMIGCVVAFLNQRSVVYRDHIQPGRELSKSPVLVQLKDKRSGAVQEAELTFVNDSFVTNPLRMGNELEEQFQSVLVALFATGILLLFVALTASRGAEPAGAGDA